MPKLIKNGQFADNPWLIIDRESDLKSCLSASADHLIVPLALWREHRDELLDSGRTIAVWLDSDEDPEDLAEDLDRLPLVALNFPAFKDGRAFSSAVTLRQRYDYKGEIRAIGEVLRDLLFYMKRCGFDAFDVSDQVRDEDALSAFGDFTTTYASTVEEPMPLFRRRSDAAGRTQEK